LNFAALKKLPVVYICENNSYAINSHQSHRHKADNIYKWAHGYDIPGYQIDGNDVLKVSEFAKAAISRCRNNEGPTLLECITYRWKGHIGTVNDVGEGLRPQSEYDYWISKCPIKWFTDYLKEIGILDENMEKSVNEEIDQKVTDAFEFAKNSPKPVPEDLFDYVYAK
jgi:pyruvate dehydrogenase E1 component alpha subunit